WQLASAQARKVRQRFGIALFPEVQMINLPPIETE
ncbi:MAG: hypothetical protein ACYC7H_04275, partial [Chloroflexota bacterium]